MFRNIRIFGFFGNAKQMRLEEYFNFQNSQPQATKSLSWSNPYQERFSLPKKYTCNMTFYSSPLFPLLLNRNPLLLILHSPQAYLTKQSGISISSLVSMQVPLKDINSLKQKFSFKFYSNIDWACCLTDNVKHKNRLRKRQRHFCLH